MTLLASLVATSRQVAATSARLAKVRLLSDFLRSLDRSELELGVLYLSGDIRQGRIGVGPSALYSCVQEPATRPELTLAEIDQAIDGLAGISGSGSTAKR